MIFFRENYFFFYWENWLLPPQNSKFSQFFCYLKLSWHLLFWRFKVSIKIWKVSSRPLLLPTPIPSHTDTNFPAASWCKRNFWVALKKVATGEESKWSQATTRGGGKRGKWLQATTRVGGGQMTTSDHNGGVRNRIFLTTLFVNAALYFSRMQRFYLVCKLRFLNCSTN